jgi:hypothetical protein
VLAFGAWRFRVWRSAFRVWDSQLLTASDF